MIGDAIDRLLSKPAHGIRQLEKEAALAGILDELTNHHIAACADYKRMVRAAYPGWSAGAGLATLPHIPVAVFKSRYLLSVPQQAVAKTLTSSGTTGAEVSRIALDTETSRRQVRALAAILTPLLGQVRRPTLIVDSQAMLRDRTQFSARGAGILGLMNFGKKHVYLLDEGMHALAPSLDEFASRNSGVPTLIFGFTYMIWQHLLRELGDRHIDLSNAVLIHSGGWKKLADEGVGDAEFKRDLREAFGITHVYNFYGMAEQVGGVHIEGDDGLLHPPSFGDVIIRDPVTWKEQPTGQAGVIQVVSALPTSYPGHSILTEDLGVVETVDSDRSPHLGKAFRVLGRIPRTELRGCSDTYSVPMQ